jgi:F-type H+-transporting ATPase subunit gamma
MLLVKPASQEIFDALVDKSFATQLFRMMLDSQASEHGARMSAMENATKNAGGMIKKLTLQFNKQRQAGITKELLEIIAGSESQKGA